MTKYLAPGARPATLAAVILLASLCASAAPAADAIRIGTSMSLTGGVAPNGKQVLLAMQIWRDDINARGGLLGRPVELVVYDDQSNPANVPGIYTKLIEIDKVDLTVGPYATNMIVPAILTLKAHNMATVGIMGVAANREIHYDRYFSILSAGPTPALTFSEGFFKLAMEQNPKPATVAITAADAEFAKVSADGARANALKAGLKIVYDRAYPPNTTDFGPIIRAVQATNPDIVYNAGYPPDTLGMVRAAHEVGLRTRMFGGNMVGLLATVFRTQLGPLLNGIVSTADVFVPAPSFDFPGVHELLAKYQARAGKEGADPLGYNFVPYGYAAMQVLGDAVAATGTLDQTKVAEYMHTHPFKTVVGDVSFNADGEWVKPRVLVVQFQHVTGNDVDQFRDVSKTVIVWPPEYASGKFLYPYADAQK